MWVSRSEEEAFGPGEDQGIVAAYYPDKDLVVIIANNALSVQDVIESLRHEIIVDKGPGVLSQEAIDTFLADAGFRNRRIAGFAQRNFTSSTHQAGKQAMV